MSVANPNSLVHPKQVTLVIHGTFADDEDWWKLGKINQPTFADRLETALSRRGTTGTVWKPVLDSSFKYTDFAWSGKNSDKDRVKGGRKLGKALNSLAGAMAATKDSPLTVNLVGHSHGGNVIL